jgi:hypothetical protein
MTALVERARALRAQGMSLRQIAAKTGRGFGTIQKLLVGWAPVPAPAAEPHLPLGGCQWPFGDPGTKAFRFCGAAIAVSGCPYCPPHRAIAYVRHPGRGGSL